ncbi:MAG: hypothetical protein DRJ42_03580 [Deltaproteobacteria bacterium]|nr:MAG: hypothetical protein DRJ42_03580 [Deltaproteobacteria bacterium]
MAAWETLLAAGGGLVLGFGVGLFVGGRRARVVAKRVRRLKARLRGSVIPILEGRAQALGLPRSKRAYATEDPLEAAVDLSTSIIQHQEQHNMALSDTVDLLRADLDSE